MATLQCSHCAAPLHATGRAARVRCAFCDADNVLDVAACAQLQQQPPIPPPAIAERLRGLAAAAQADPQAFLDILARRLQAAVPARVQVEKKGGILRKPRIARVRLEAGELHYAIELAGSRVEGKRSHVVRGVALKSQPLAPAELLGALAAELYEEAQASPDAQAALERFLAG